MGGYTFQMKLDEFLNRSDEMRPQWAIEARELITDLGVTFIKIAQVWASRPAAESCWILACEARHLAQGVPQGPLKAYLLDADGSGV